MNNNFLFLLFTNVKKYDILILLNILRGFYEW